ncbi:hypothetical protein N1851_034191 [Merluccius polli]|uniref:DDE Tnp4 domain-containing protein n=1 Tax=Merluccius polli TaxID=89951 RepID=A0AA47NLM4_MERPO|nr:hypothetical protein N1851_034191 [Merluccius polli]
MEHDYVSDPDPAVVDLVLEENASLREEIRLLRGQVDSLTLRQRFGIHRFQASDKDIRFFTRVASYDLLIHFWAFIEPSLPSIRGTLTESNAATHSLQPIDELFLFLNYLALGSKQWDLADCYNVHQSTVSRSITSWSNFLFTVLGSTSRHTDDTTVILDCTELRCQCPSSPLLQSEVFSSYKSHCTLKGLIGIAPHGAVTFISALYAGSISDKQITRESGLLTLLKPGMAVMVDRGFLIEDIVPCKIYRPPFLSGRSQMSAGEVRETQAIARLRVHVEGLICWVKEHKFFDSEIPLQLFGSINQLYTVACLLTNYENGPLRSTGALREAIGFLQRPQTYLSASEGNTEPYHPERIAAEVTLEQLGTAGTDNAARSVARTDPHNILPAMDYHPHAEHWGNRCKPQLGVVGRLVE